MFGVKGALYILWMTFFLKWDILPYPKMSISIANRIVLSAHNIINLIKQFHDIHTLSVFYNSHAKFPLSFLFKFQCI